MEINIAGRAAGNAGEWSPVLLTAPQSPFRKGLLKQKTPGVLTEGLQTSSPSSQNSLPQPQFIIRCVSVQTHGEHGPFPWGTSIGIVPLEAEFIPPAEVTVPKHTGTALQFLEKPLDFPSKPCHTTVYISIQGISISTRFKVYENFLLSPYARLLWADLITNDARVIRLQILGRLSLKKKNSSTENERKLGMSQEEWTPCCQQVKAMARFSCSGSPSWFKISARGYCSDETIQFKLLSPRQRAVYLFEREGLISTEKISYSWSQDHFPLNCWNTKPSSCLGEEKILQMNVSKSLIQRTEGQSLK